MDDNTSHVIISGNDIIQTGNDSNDVVCREDTPYSYELLQNHSTSQLVLMLLLGICVIINFAIFLEEVVFIIRHFRTSERKQKTIYVLALMPVGALCAAIGVIIPRSGILVDLVSYTYFGFAVYSWMGLIDDYLGTDVRTKATNVTVLSLATPPCCCCCVCLPKFTFNKKTHLRLLIMVYQVTVIRPILAFLAAVLWADGQFIPGSIGNNAFTYVTCLNTVSTLFAVWGLVIVQKAFRQLLREYSLFLKFVVLQLTLVGTVLSNIVITVLVSKGVIQCTELISTGARAVRLDNSFLVLWMLLLAFLGRIAFRREKDGLSEWSADTERRTFSDDGSTTVTHNDLISTEADGMATSEKEAHTDLNRNI